MKAFNACVLYVSGCWLLATSLSGVLSEEPPQGLECSQNETHTCNHANWAYQDEDSRGCACDPLCAEYGDCCYDSVYYDRYDQVAAAKDYRCTKVNYENGVYMKASCPLEWQDEEVARLCRTASPEWISSQEDPLLHVPVTSNVTNVTYTNYYCAVCNNDSDDAMFWNVDVVCSVPTNYSQDDLVYKEGRWGVIENEGGEEVFHKCDIALGVWNLLLFPGRSCKSVIDECIPFLSDQHIRDLCESYTSIVSRDGILFKNAFCAECNGVLGINVKCDLKSFIEYDFPLYSFLPPSPGVRFGLPEPKAFSLLIDFSCRGRNSKVGESCEVFDPFSKSKRSLITSVPESTHGNLVNTTPKNNVTVPSPSEPSCTNRTLLNDEFHIINETVFELASNHSYAPGEYIEVDGGVLVCSNLTFTDRYSPAMGWVTLAGLGMSSLCLALHLVSFSLVPHLRNLNGKNLASLSVSLLLAYVSFILSFFADTWATECYVLAVLIFFFFLASFSWMNVLGFDVFYAFRRAQNELRVSSGEQWQRFCLYSIYGWLLPFIGVAVVVAIDLAAPSSLPVEFLPSFGQHVCWFGQRKALLLFFGVPLFFAIVLNVVLFVATSAIIATTRQSEVRKSSSSSRQRRKQFLTYLRLAVLMGLSWITAALASYFQEEAVYYVFIVLNSLQGVFIFLAFTCRTKVWTSIASRRVCCLEPFSASGGKPSGQRETALTN